jgi:hypothetical protein
VRGRAAKARLRLRGPFGFGGARETNVVLPVISSTDFGGYPLVLLSEDGCLFKSLRPEVLVARSAT